MTTSTYSSTVLLANIDNYNNGASILRLLFHLIFIFLFFFFFKRVIQINIQKQKCPEAFVKLLACNYWSRLSMVISKLQLSSTLCNLFVPAFESDFRVKKDIMYLLSGIWTSLKELILWTHSAQLNFSMTKHPWHYVLQHPFPSWFITGRKKNNKNQKQRPANPLNTLSKNNSEGSQVLSTVVEPRLSYSNKNVYFADKLTLLKLFLKIWPSIRPCKQPEFFIQK